MIKKNHALKLLLLAGFYMSFPYKTFAEQQDIAQDEIVVVGTKTKHSVFNSPGTVSTINTDSLENRLATDIEAILKNESGARVTGVRKNGQEITMRGYKSDSIVFLVDDIPQSFFSAHDGVLFIDPTLLQSVEVAYGSASSLYGSGGLGGVISFITKDAKDLLKQGQTRGASIGLGYSSVNSEFLTTAKTYGITEKYDYVFATSYTQGGDIKLGDGNTLPSEDKIASALVKTTYHVNESNALKLNLNYYNNDAYEPNNPRELQEEGGRVVVNDASLDKYTANFNTSLMHEYNGNSYNTKSGFYYQGVSLNEFVKEDDPLLAENSGNKAGDELDRDFSSLGFFTNANVGFTTGILENNFVYGLNLRQESQDSSHTRFGAVNGVPKASANYYDGFVQTESSLNALKGKLTLLAGVNYSIYNSKNSTNLTNKDNATSPKFGLSYNNDFLTLFTNYSYGFRAPKMTELYAAGEHFGYSMGPMGSHSNNFVENPDLKPETNRTFEAGAGVKFSLLGDVSLKASYFNTDSKNFIDRQIQEDGFFGPLEDITRFINVGKAEIQGVDAKLAYSVEKLKMSLSYNYVDGKNTTDPTNITSLESTGPDTLVLNVSYKLGSLSNIALRATFADGYTRDLSTRDEAQEKIAGYGVLDAYYGINLNESININLGVENILNKEYTVLTSYYVQEGRSYKAFLNYKF